MDRPSILIADDHTLVVDGIVELLRQDAEVVGRAETGPDLLEQAKSIHADVYMLDIKMPGLNGFETARKLLEQKPDANILFFTGHCSSAYIQEAFRIGAKGFLSKFADCAALGAAVNSVARGEYYLSPHAQKELESRGEQLRLLTTRQRDVLKLIAQGLSAKEIGYRLGISQRTAEFHRNCIVERLDLHSTAELTRFAWDNGLVSPLEIEGPIPTETPRQSPPLENQLAHKAGTTP
jgi:Response regulator containing a CheY-like receiver domain and an HTH DNA-binding domain